VIVFHYEFVAGDEKLASVTRACHDCPLRPRCTNNYRAVSRLENEDALDRMAARLGQRPDILARCREIVEHPLRHDQAMDEPGRLSHARPSGTRFEAPITKIHQNTRDAHRERSTPDFSHGLREFCTIALAP
jgi:hypothetical protein